MDFQIKTCPPARKLAGILCLILLMAVVIWKIALPDMTAAARAFLLSEANKALNGRLEAGDIDLSPLGQASFRQVRLYDPANSLVAQCELITADFSPGDLWRGSLNLNAIRRVSVDGLKLYLRQNEAGSWNTATIAKTAGDRPFAFRGDVGLKDAAVSIVTLLGSHEYRAEGTIDFARYPTLGLNVRAADGGNALSVQGTWMADGPGSIIIKADKLDIADYQTLFPEAFNIKMPGGSLTDVAITITQDDSRIRAEGTAAMLDVIVVLDGVAADAGRVELRLNDGSLAASLAGSAAEPSVKGTFKVSAGTIGLMDFADANGAFTYTKDGLSIADTQIGALGGFIRTGGILASKTTGYVQHVTGRNIDSAELIEESAIQGRVDFVADISGRGGWRSADADASFSMTSGSSLDGSFRNLTGNITKRGPYLSYRNVRGQVEDGLARVIGASNGESLRFSIIVAGIQVATKTIRAPQIKALF